MGHTRVSPIHVITFLLIAACFLAPSLPARAEVFQTARTLKPGALSLGFEPQVFLASPPAYQFSIHGGVGVTRGFDLHARYSFPVRSPYVPSVFALDGEVLLLPDRDFSPALSATIGLHTENWSRYALDGTLMVSKVFRRFEPYLALDADVYLPPNQVQALWKAVGGFAFRVSQPTELLLELGTGLNYQQSWLSFGINFYI